jgi:hypothetical protein
MPSINKISATFITTAAEKIKGSHMQRAQFSFFSLPTPVLSGSGYKSIISAFMYLATYKVKHLYLKKDSALMYKKLVP